MSATLKLIGCFYRLRKKKPRRLCGKKVQLSSSELFPRDELMKDVMPEVHRRLREKRQREKQQSTRKPRRKMQKIDLDPGATVSVEDYLEIYCPL